MSVKVSVITPSFNHGRYIEQNIKSVESQDYENIEHLIIDGGSTDNTFSILKKHPKVKWISGSDRGFADAVNKGIILSSGDLLTIQNADDFYYGKKAISHLVKAFENCPNAGLIFGGELMIKGETIVDVFIPTYFSYVDLLLSKYTIPQCSAAFKREVVKEVGYLSEDADYYSDSEYWFRIGVKFEIVPIQKVISYYRLYEDQRSDQILKHLGERKRMVTAFFKTHDLPLNIRRLYRRAIAGAYDWDAKKVKGGTLKIRRLYISLYFLSFLYDPRTRPIRKIIGRSLR